VNAWVLPVAVALFSLVAVLVAVRREQREAAAYKREREARRAQRHAFFEALAARWAREPDEAAARTFVSSVRGRHVRVRAEPRRDDDDAVTLSVVCEAVPLRDAERVTKMMSGRSQEDVFLSQDAGVAAVLGPRGAWVLWGAGAVERAATLPEAWVRWLDANPDLDVRSPGLTFVRGEVRTSLAAVASEELDAKVEALCAVAEAMEARP